MQEARPEREEVREVANVFNQDHATARVQGSDVLTLNAGDLLQIALRIADPFGLSPAAYEMEYRYAGNCGIQVMPFLGG